MLRGSRSRKPERGFRKPIDCDCGPCSPIGGTSDRRLTRRRSACSKHPSLRIEGVTHMHAIVCCLALCGVSDEPYKTWVVDNNPPAKLPASGGQRLTSAQLIGFNSNKPVPPNCDLTLGERDKDGGIWLGSKHGLMYLAPSAPRWRLFH